MTIKYKLYEYAFDWQAWAASLQELIAVNEVDTWAELLDVHTNTLSRWRSGKAWNKNTPYPNMTNFLKVCNALEIAPHEYFKMVEA